MSVRPRNAVAILHVAFEGLGLLKPILEEALFEITHRNAATLDFDDPHVSGADLLVVLGGPIGVYETEAYPFLSKELTLLERRLSKDLPTLGICLGAQLMAAALGARVYPGPVKEIGWGRVNITEAGRGSCLGPLGEEGALVLHWHGDTFDLPRSATRLAGNAHYQNQAFALGAHALALQFHAEVDPDTLERWFVGHAVELAGAGMPVRDLRAATTAVSGTVRAQARNIFLPWLRQLP